MFLALEPSEIYTRFISGKEGHSARKKLLTLVSLLEHNIYHRCDNFSEENEMCWNLKSPRSSLRDKNSQGDD